MIAWCEGQNVVGPGNDAGAFLLSDPKRGQHTSPALAQLGVGRPDQDEGGNHTTSHPDRSRPR